MNENIRHYEANLAFRLSELRNGHDPAYIEHIHAILETVVRLLDQMPTEGKPRFLDIGCGLGFLTRELTRLQADVVGIDSSQETIELAQIEHPTIKFYPQSAENFSIHQKELGESDFDLVVLNMVLHAVDDNSVLAILKSAKKCLKKEGAVLILVPTQHWLMRKLVADAQNRGMDREEGLSWVGECLEAESVSIPIQRFYGQWPEPIIIFNRNLEQYGELLELSGFGVNLTIESNGVEINHRLPFITMDDSSNVFELSQHDKEILVSFSR